MLKGFIPDPKPSSFYIPDNFKKLPPIIKTETAPTVKKCIPFLDSLMAGYIIPFPCDWEVYYDEENTQMKFNMNVSIEKYFSELLGITNHPEYQITNQLRNPKRTVDAVFKFASPWKIITPKGYSCLFVTPFNHVLPFDLITGIVDTDEYPASVNLPFYWTQDIKKRTILQKGSPMAMVIPFKRESWEMSIKAYSKTEFLEPKERLSFFSKISNNYKNLIWKKKSFK